MQIALAEIYKLLPQLLMEYRLELEDPNLEWKTLNFWFHRQTGIKVRVSKRWWRTEDKCARLIPPFGCAVFLTQHRDLWNWLYCLHSLSYLRILKLFNLHYLLLPFIHYRLPDHFQISFPPSISCVRKFPCPWTRSAVILYSLVMQPGES